MFGISYGELFLLLGATAALIGPKDLPVIARTAGRFSGRSIGYVQLARGQFGNVMQKSQVHQVHKELKDTMALLEAIRQEIRSISVLSPGPQTRRLVDDIGHAFDSDASSIPENEDVKDTPKVILSDPCTKQRNGGVFQQLQLPSQATAFARLANSFAPKTGSLENDTDAIKLMEDIDLPNVLPVSAASAGMLPHRAYDVKRSEIVLEAIPEAEVARSAKDFFAQP